MNNQTPPLSSSSDYYVKDTLSGSRHAGGRTLQQSPDPSGRRRPLGLSQALSLGLGYPDKHKNKDKDKDKTCDAVIV